MSVTWNATWHLLPKNAESPSLGDDRVRDAKDGIEERAKNEHTTYSGDGTLGVQADDWLHKAGSAQAWYQSGNPTQPYVNGKTGDTSANGRLSIDSATKTLKYYVDGTGWISLMSVFGSVNKILTDTGYTVLDADGFTTFLMSTGGSNRTLTLPTAADNTGREITVIKTDSGAGKVIIDGEGAETIDGLTALDLIYQYAKTSLVCDGSNWAITSGHSLLFHIQDEKAQATNGGTFTSGAWRTRDLNTAKTNEIVGASLSSNQFTLPVGTYHIEWLAPAFAVNQHQSKLRNITDGSDQMFGTSSQSSTASGERHSFGAGRFTITTTKIFEIQHKCGITKTTFGFGAASNQSTEIYTSVSLKRL